MHVPVSVRFPVLDLHGHKVRSYNSLLSRLPSTLPVRSEFTEIRTQCKQTVAATALHQLSGPPGGTPASTLGVGSSVPSRKLISIASQFEKRKRSTCTVCICALRCVSMWSGGGEGWRVEYRRVGVWKTKPGMVGISKMVYSISNRVWLVCWFTLVGKWTFHIFGLGA